MEKKINNEDLKITKVEESDNITQEESDNITQEERDSIYKEMEQMLALSQNKKQVHSDMFSTIRAKKKFRFPIIVNVLIVLFMIGTVGGTYAYFYSSDENFFITQAKTNFADNVLVQILINDIKTDTEELQTEIENITSELENKRAEQTNLDAEYEEKFTSYKVEVDAEYEKNLRDIRLELEAKGLSSKELETALSARQKVLEAEQKRKYNEFARTQAVEKSKVEEQYRSQIAQLQNTLSTNQTEINSLEEKLTTAVEKSKEAENVSKAVATKKAIDDDNKAKNAQSLDGLRAAQQKKEKELKLVSFMYDRAVTLLAKGNLGGSRKEITTARTRISRGEFQVDSDFVSIDGRLDNITTVINALEKFEVEIKTTNLAKNTVNPKILIENDKLKDDIKAQEAELQAQQVTIKEQETETKKQQLETLKKDKDLQKLEKRIADISKSLAATDDTKELSKKQKAIRDKIQLIALYFARKQQSLDVGNLEDEVRTLIVNDSYYRFIGNIIATAFDPSGELLLNVY